MRSVNSQTLQTDAPPGGMQSAPTPNAMLDPYINAASAHQRGSYDELLDSSGNVRPHWQGLIAALDQLGPADRSAAMAHSRRLLLDNDVSYQPPGAIASRPWQLDLLPFVLAPEEFERLQAGLAQRTRLLEAIVADCLGPQRLLTEGRIPPAVVFGAGVFFPACHGIDPPGNKYLYLTGFDLARSPDGQWWVVRNRTAMPSGLGYALESRIIASQCLTNIFEQTAVRRVSGFFRAFSDSLQLLAGRETPLNLVLTSQERGHEYFEHAILGRYLGHGVVTGGDLTVRDQRVYLKTVRGLQAVDLLIRRIETGRCDPLELRSDATDGVPGLMQAVRSGHVRLANWPGTEIADSPALNSFLPSLCEHLLGESLLLPSAASWWCGQQREQTFVLDNLEKLIVRRIDQVSPLHSGSQTGGATTQFHGGLLTAAQRSELISLIRQFPTQFVGQEPVNVSVAPAWNDAGDIVPAATSLRLYMTRSANDFVLMPGGIARADSYPPGTGYTTRLPNERNKDVWVSDPGRTDAYGSAASLLRGVQRLQRSDINLASRSADNLFWLGSYMERADGAIRLFRTLIQQTSGEYVLGQQVATLDRLAAVLVANRHLSARRARRLVAMGKPSFAYGLSQISFDPDSADNLHAIVANIARIADAVRERLSPDMWRLLERVTQMPSGWSNEPVLDPMIAISKLNAMADAMAAINGIIALNMTRADGWRFLDIGRRIERIRQTARLFRELGSRPDQTEQGSLNLLLELADCAITYRMRYSGPPQFGPVADLVLGDDTQPRSMLTQVNALKTLLAALPVNDGQRIHGPGEVQLLRLESRLRLMGLHELDSKRGSNGLRINVRRLTKKAEEDADAITTELTAQYFSHATGSRVSGQGTQLP